MMQINDKMPPGGLTVGPPLPVGPCSIISQDNSGAYKGKREARRQEDSIKVHLQKFSKKQGCSIKKTKKTNNTDPLKAPPASN